MLSKMIVFSIVAVPALWFIYTLLLIFFAPLRLKTVILVAMCFPVSLSCALVNIYKQLLTGHQGAASQQSPILIL